MSKIVSLKNKEFKEVYSKRISRANKLLIMYIRKNHLPINRFGISVSKKVGNSVVRHRFCRLARESFRAQEENLKTGYDIVVVARNAVVGVKCQEIERAFCHLCSMHHIIKSVEETEEHTVEND